MKHAVQHHYDEGYSYCYGCGCNNERGLQIKTHWDGAEGRGVFTPRPEHMAMPGFVYGGLLASLVDCHGVATAAASVVAEGLPVPRYVTASLHVDFLRPTPLGPELHLSARVAEVRGRKIVVAVEIAAEGRVCVRGEVVAAPIPEKMRNVAGTIPAES